MNDSSEKKLKITFNDKKDLDNFNPDVQNNVVTARKY